MLYFIFGWHVYNMCAQLCAIWLCALHIGEYTHTRLEQFLELRYSQKKNRIDSWNLVCFEDIELCLDCWFVNVWTSIMGERNIKSCLGLLTGKILSYLAHNSFCLSTKKSIFIQRSLWITGVKFTRVCNVVGNPSCLKQSINFSYDNCYGNSFSRKFE